MSDGKDFILGTIEVPQVFHQLGILVLDGSGSMAGMGEGRITKAAAVSIAVKDLLSLLITSKNKKNFSISVITFDDNVSTHTPVTRVKDDTGNTVDDNANYNPMIGHGGGTDIARALEESHSLAEQFINNAPPNSVPHSVVIIVLSDGESQTDPVPVADKIKQNPNITVCSTLFAQKGNSDTQAKQVLMDIATTTEHYKTVYDAETLRKFFIASMSSGRNFKIE